jgi:hypothetical protein
MALESILKKTAVGFALVATIGILAPKDQKINGQHMQPEPSIMEQARDHMNSAFIMNVYDELWKKLGYMQENLSRIPDSVRYGTKLVVTMDSQNMIYQLSHQGQEARYAVSKEHVQHELDLLR